MAKYYKSSPTIIEAFQWTGNEYQREDPIWLIDMLKTGKAEILRNPLRLHIKTKRGNLLVLPGDFVSRDPKSMKIRVHNPAKFESEYTLLEEES